MKSVFSVLALSFFAAGAAHAEYRGGVIAGLNVASLSGDSTTTNSATNFLGGVYGEFGIQDGFYFAPQLRYNEQGGKVVAASGTTAVEAELSLKYLEIPLYVKYKYALDHGIAAFAFAGPNVGFKVGSSETARAVIGGQTFERTTSIGSPNALNLSLDAGIGAEYALNDKVNVNLSGAYSWGLTNVYDNASFKTRAFQLYAGVSYLY
jgi:opacity protein-like surface antigen